MAGMNAARPAKAAAEVAGGRVLVAVIGPPGVGKTTVAAALADHGGVRVFRLREAVRARPEVLAGLAPSADPLGWVSLEAVRRVLRAAFMEHRFPLCAAPVLLDNFPGTADQLDSLAEVASLVGARVAVLELRARVATVVVRVAERRVCPTCGPDSHAPASPADTGADRCGACGGSLVRRESDVPRLHGLRLARYLSNATGIAGLAAERGIPYLTVSAEHPAPEVVRLARDAFERLTSFTPAVSADRSGSRS